MSLATPDMIRRLQEALGTKAKQEPTYRFYLLYDKVYRADVLAHAYALAKQRDGAPGVDGETFEAIEAAGRERWLAAMQEALRTGTYRPQPVRRVRIPKPAGGERPLGIPTIRDRVVQTAVLLILQPIFEADMEPTAYGYRPKRTAREAVETAHRALCAGQTQVVDADVSQYFDTIPHAALMQAVARRLSDRKLLRLLKRWLKAPVAEQTGRGGWRYTGGKRATQGIPQGGVISPLLANLYLNGLDHAVNEKCEQKPTMVRYADDLVILAKPGQGAGLQARLKRWLEARELKLNEEKTRLVDTRKEGFEFLGFAVAWRRSLRSGKRYVHVEPSAKSRTKLRDKVRAVLEVRTQNQPAVAVVRKVNQITRGWAAAFHYGNCTRVFAKQQIFVRNRLRRWLWRKSGRTHGLFEFFNHERLHGQYQLWQWPRTAGWTT